MKTKIIHFIKKCADENLRTLFKQTILNCNVFSIYRIFYSKNRIFDFQKCFLYYILLMLNALFSTAINKIFAKLIQNRFDHR